MHNLLHVLNLDVCVYTVNVSNYGPISLSPLAEF